MFFQPEDKVLSNVPSLRLRHCPSVPSIDYWQKGVPLLCFGLKGSEPGRLNWPRGLCWLPGTGDLVVCDSGNHRLQIYDTRGHFIRELGTYGVESGEFDSPAGLAVNRYGQIAVSDRY